jgi:multiphosphoryl transfer protein
MVGIVIVSHSYGLAEGIKALAVQMVHDAVPIASAGGLDEQELGTNVLRILSAIEEVHQPDGVLVLIDLGSAELSTRMAIEMLPEEWQDSIRISPAPLVEGTLAAVVEAAQSHSLDKVDRAARAVAVLAKLSEEAGVPPVAVPMSDTEPQVGPRLEAIVTVPNSLGIHARPAAMLAQTAGKYQADIWIENQTRGLPAVSARSLFALLGIGAEKGHEVRLLAQGVDAAEALLALQELVQTGFGEREENVLPLSAPEKALITTPVEKDWGVLNGVAASEGVAIGPAFRYADSSLTVELKSVEEPAVECERFCAAVAAAAEQVSSVLQAVPDEAKAIMKVHRLMLADLVFQKQVCEYIQVERINAEAALMKVCCEYKRLLTGSGGAVFAQRAVDVDDIARRILSVLRGSTGETVCQPEVPVILVARDLGPAEVLGLNLRYILGICLAEGGSAAHTSILARNLGIPLVVGLGAAAEQIREGTLIILDGSKGQLILAAKEEVLAQYRARQEQALREKKLQSQRAHEPAVARDGHRMTVEANAADPQTVALARAEGADGIGLLRTEFLFLNHPVMPSEEEQERIYHQVLDAAGGLPVTFRTLDIGGDKPVPYLNIGKELNPSLGLRAIRYCLAEPEAFRVQLRAILRAASGRKIRLMFPMISLAAELRQARDILNQERAALAHEKVPPAELEVGIMVETPAAALTADRLAAEVDFFNVGSNDLIQYTMACDRTNERVAYLYQPLQIAILRLIRQVVVSARRFKIRVEICGDMAGDSNCLPYLIGLGMTDFSVAPLLVAKVKADIRLIQPVEAEARLDDLLLAR